MVFWECIILEILIICLIDINSDLDFVDILILVNDDVIVLIWFILNKLVFVICEGCFRFIWNFWLIIR